MTAFVALLRAVNLGSHGKVAMPALRDMLVGLGFADPRTLLNSGNAVFSSKGTAAALEAKLEKEAAKQLGLTTEFFVRTAAEWDAIVAANPFAKEAKDAPGFLVLVCLKEAPSTAAVKALQAASKGPEQIRAGGRQLYVTYPDRQGRSKLTTPLMAKHVGTNTARNWNTVLKVQALLAE